MTTLQNDLLEIYNTLVVFNNETIKSQFPTPIEVYYEKDSRVLVLKQKGNTVRLRLPVYYCLGLEDIDENHSTYLTPEGYDSLMYNLQRLINSGELIKDRTCLSPENFGFDIYATDLKEMWKGPGLLGSIRFISGKSRLFKWWIKYKYKL